MKKTFIISLLTAAIAVGCNNPNTHTHPEGEEHIHAAEHEDPSAETEAHDLHDHDEHSNEEHAAESPDHSGEIIFTKEQAARTDFELYKVEPSAFHEVIATSGRIMPAQGDEATVSAPVSGIVSLSGKKLSDGATVQKGETLFTISSKEIADGDYITRVRTTYEQAKTAYERAEKLVADKIVTQSEYEQAKAAYEQAKAAYEAVKDKSSDQGVEVSSPIRGFIKNTTVTEGAFVETGQPLVTVSQNRKLQLRAEVSQKYLNALQTVTDANFKLPYDDRLYSLSEMNGRLLSVGHSTDVNAAFLPVIFEFDNSGNVIPGSFAEIYLLSAPQQNVLTVPISAVTEDQGIYYVFVQLDEEGYMKREVEIGASDGKNIRILSGLSAGETVVSRGAIQVKMASFSGAIPHGHSHAH